MKFIKNLRLAYTSNTHIKLKGMITMLIIWIVLLVFVYTFFFVINLAMNSNKKEAIIPKQEIIIQYVEVIRYMPVQYQNFEVTAYTAGYESTKKKYGDIGYGITASGEVVTEMTTIACPDSLSFGTRVYIQELENVFTCQDRGSAIEEGKLDVYMEDLKDAQVFGRQKLKVLVLPKNLEKR
jgi:3D (Asp-Asp-Asp) domain-containing protein